MSEAIEILRFDSSSMVVAKPAGLATTSPPGTDSLEHRLRRQFPQHAAYLHAVHRLDACVSGVVVIATGKKAARLLSQQFETRKVSKKYWALVRGRLDGETQLETVWRQMIRKRTDQAMVDVVSEDPDDAEISSASRGKLAKTRVQILRQIEHPQPATLLQLRPETGRMHQLRVQCAEAGHPILGDSLYEFGLAVPRGQSIALHACQLGYFDVRSAKAITVTCEYPESLNNWFASIESKP